MEGSENSKDETSIKPVSSLRSRFENLDKDKGTTPASPIVGRSPFLSATISTSDGRPVTPVGGRSSFDLSNANRPNALPQATPRLRRPSPPKSRPQSMVALSPAPVAPPLLTVDSPKSPGKTRKASLDLRPSATTPVPSSTAPPLTRGDSPIRPQSRVPSRATTPASGIRTSALPVTVEAPNTAPDALSAVALAPEVPQRMETANNPPPVNRAGKPKIPTKPTSIVKKLESLSLPQPATEPIDKSASPFSTPPGSGTSSPQPNGFNRPRNASDASFVQRLRGESEASFVQRLRTDSDASFVERVRTDSDASSHQLSRDESSSASVERARAGSSASFVEPSSLPDPWHHRPPPPTHHHVAARRDQQMNGPSMVARYQSVGSREGSAAGDSPDSRPRLPSRPELQQRSGRTSPTKARSGRTSPLKNEHRIARRSTDGLKRAAAVSELLPPQRIPATIPTQQRTALSQGFDRTTPSPTSSTDRIIPAVPAPRRSMDRRREMPPPVTVSGAHVDGESRDDDSDGPILDGSNDQATAPGDYPDSSQASRRTPKYKQRPWQIPTDYDTRTFAVCGEYVCTTGHRTKAWNLRTGEQLLDLEHHEIVKVSSLVFKPSATVEDEGRRLWLGTSIGEIHEVDVPSQAVVKTKAHAHTRREIVRMFRYASELWTLDDGGDLNVWKPDHKGMPSLDSQCTNFRTPKGHTFSIALGSHLWVATGKDLRVFAPSASSDREFQVLWNPLTQPGTGEIHSGATLSSKPDLVYFGHQDGKVSIYNRNDYTCSAVVNVSMYKLSSLAGVGDYLWAGFSTGMAYVYDVSSTPWRVKKDWQAHDRQICGIAADRSALWKINRLQVITLGTDQLLKIWDGMLEEDWLDNRMQEHDSEYCSFREITAAVLTWNAGASKPGYLQHTKEDNNFFREYMTSSKDPPDLFVFGFQELVDLEDKKVTAKSFFKSKKKDANEQEHMSHQYRAWRDHLTRCLEDFMPTDQPYALLHTASLVGLFTCVFVKASLRSSVRHVHAAEVKRGMGGKLGNKGALVLRMVVDDSSICLINCHLAAGQTQTIHRNNDVAGILETEALPAYPLSSDSQAQHVDVFTSGGDGSMILDHEICILNGDLNYRIDTMGRDTVIKHINQKNLARLLERDQLLLSRKKNPGFRLRAFQEKEITFAPTYKYNLQSDEYDTSEKRRSPAWCDRILYRGLGKVKMEEYRRWEVKVSDHRPVSGKLRLRVKTVDETKRAKVWEVCQQEFEQVRKKVARAVQLEHLTDVLGLTQKEAVKALQTFT